MSRIIAIIFVYISFAAAFMASAQDYVPLAPLPGAAPRAGTNLSVYLPNIFKLSIGIAAVLAVIMMIVGGLEYMSTDAVSGKNNAKERIWAAVQGLALALFAFLLLKTINPALVNMNIATEKIEVQAHKSLLQQTTQQTMPSCNDVSNISGRWCFGGGGCVPMNLSTGSCEQYGLEGPPGGFYQNHQVCAQDKGLCI